MERIMNIEPYTMQRYAFISYSHHDMRIARWLHRKLESYRLPAEIRNEFEESRYLRPVFRDQDDLNAGILSDELAQHLKTSKFLIIICSRNSAHSHWMSEEVRQFVECGRLEYIIPVLVDDFANSFPTESFPEYLREFTRTYPDRELLAVSFKENGREQAFIRVVSRMLGVSFDVLWQRHRRAQRRKLTLTSISVSMVAVLLYYLAMPISLTVRLTDDVHNLPPTSDAILTIGDVTYQISRTDTMLCVEGFPGYYRGHSLQIRFTATYYQPLECSVRFGAGLRQKIQLTTKRDSTFAYFCGQVVDEQGCPVQGAQVTVDESNGETDESGHFTFTFSTPEQREYKFVKVTKPGYIPLTRSQESPGKNIIYVLRRLQ